MNSAKKYIRVPVLEVLPTALESQKIYNHWRKMLSNLLVALGVPSSSPSSRSKPSSESSSSVGPPPSFSSGSGSDSGSSSSAVVAPTNGDFDKLAVTCGYVSPDVFALIEHYSTYEDAMQALDKLYRKRKNVIYARHLLATAYQEANETVTDFRGKLLSLARDCAFATVTAEQHQEESVRDALIAGLRSPKIRLRLLEDDELTLDQAVTIADSLERAQKFSSSYESGSINSAPVLRERTYSIEYSLEVSAANITYGHPGSSRHFLEVPVTIVETKNKVIRISIIIFGKKTSFTKDGR